MNFLETLAPYALKHGAAYNVLPSLILAQGIHETGSGTSELARNANNLFGIKKGSGWEGEVYSVVTHEYRKSGEKYFITAEFRKYDSFEGSVIDLCEKYTKGLDWEPHNRYAAVPGNFVFASAAQASKDAGYATDPLYPSKLVGVYDRYNLAQYDVGFIIDEIIKEDTPMLRVVFDAGHGKNTAGKRTPAGEREWTFNNVVVRAAIAELANYEGVEVLRIDDPTGNTDVPLSRRTAKANSWNGSILVSVHHNANLGRWGTWTGTETYVMSPASSNPGSMRLAQAVHPRLVGAMGLRDRGIKAANFHMLRETRMPAILTEGGYMDSSIDIVKMRNNAVLRNAGVAIAKGVASYGKLKRKAEVEDNLFRVRLLWSKPDSQIGAYSELEGAKVIADASIKYNVYDSDGNVVYNPRKARDEQLAKEAAEAKAEAERIAAEKAAKEAEELTEIAIVVNSFADIPSVEKLALRKNMPIYFRGAMEGKVAKTLLVAGGGTDGLEGHADTLVDLSGESRLATAVKVDEYMRK